MIKRYLLLGSALCFMTVGVSRCPFPFSAKGARVHMTQAPTVVKQTAAVPDRAPRL
ncbi:MAG: hypothetical protein P4N60_14830 [Verrucomicrobiae bacterium]|nr:hypothetical protein [Verrucomicrobiae bacterium]